MRDLDQLVTALREQAEGVKPVALLAGVRHGARRMRRRRQVAALTGVVVVVVGAVGGSALVSRGHGSRSAPASPSTAATAAKAVTASRTAAAPPVRGLDSLVGTTWYLVGWNIALKDGVPLTEQPPTLRFTASSSHAGDNAFVTAVVGSGSLVWPLKIDPDTMNVGRPVATGASTSSVVAALTSVLTPLTSWQVNDGQLMMQANPGGDALTFTSTPPPPGDSPARALLGKTWHLTSVMRLGRTWVPDTRSTLVYRNTAVAVTDDGDNTQQWRVEMAPTTVSWAPGEASVVGATIAANEVATGVSGVLVGTTAWSVTGSTLVLRGPDGGSLTYSTTVPPPPAPLGTVTVTLSATHVAGVTTIGKSDVAGLITIFDPDGGQVWGAQSPTVTASLDVPSGRYSAKATITDGICTPGAIEVPAGQKVTLTLSCRDGMSTT